MIQEFVDKKKIEAILKKYFQSYIDNNDPFEKTLVYIDKEIKGIISYSIIYERAEVNYIVVLEKYRGKGIADKLLKSALDDMRKNGCNIVSLEVEISNEKAINLYLKNGFKIESIREKYYENKDGYLMVKDLEVEI